MATSKIGKGTVLADNEEEQYKSPYEEALETGKDIAAPTPTPETAIAPSATIEDDGYDDGVVREPAKLNNWYETLFRQDNAGEEADISDEQRKRMARRERAERVIAGLGDIGTHIANIALAGRGATPAKPTTTMSENLDKAWSRYNQDIETRRKEYRLGLNNARKLDYQRFLDDRKQQLAYDREDRLRLQQQAQNDYRQDLLELRQAEWEFKKAQLEAKAPKELALLEARVESLKEQAALSKARAEGRVPMGRSSSGGAKQSSSRYTTPDGKVCRNSTEFYATLRTEARKYGIQFNEKGLDYARLYDEVCKKRVERGLPAIAGEQSATNGSNKTTDKQENREKMDISGYLKK